MWHSRVSGVLKEELTKSLKEEVLEAGESRKEGTFKNII